jgi:hypothetical protein
MRTPIDAISAARARSVRQGSAVVALGLLFLLGIPGGIWAGPAAAPARTPVIVFYAAETTAQAAASENYATVLRALRASPNPIAASIAESIARDAKEYPAAVKRDSAIVLEAARRLGIDLLLFTNALAVERHYVRYRAANRNTETRNLPELPPPASAVLAASPLSRPDYFRAALNEIGALYPPNTVDALLVTLSHGNGDMAMMPRVFADLTSAGPIDLSAELDGDAAQDARPDWAAYQGTGKLEYWRVLSEINAAFGVEFPVVFRAACESGLSGWTEYLAVPASVGVLAHTARQGLKYDQVDYSAAFAGYGPGRQWTDAFLTQLTRDGIQVDPGRMLWLGPLRETIDRIYPGLFFVPLLVWLVWFGRLRFRARPSRARAILAPRGAGEPAE